MTPERIAELNAARLATCLPELQAIGGRFVAACEAEGITLLVTCGARTQAEQEELYAHGRDGDPRPIVTWTLDSAHVRKAAIDVVPLRDGSPDWSSSAWPRIIALAKGLGLDAGADFPHPDNPHFQLLGWRGLPIVRKPAS